MMKVYKVTYGDDNGYSGRSASWCRSSADATRERRRLIDEGAHDTRQWATVDIEAVVLPDTKDAMLDWLNRHASIAE